MALIKKVRNTMPVIGKDCYLAETATIIGDVVIGDYCSLWFNVVLRGDVNAIRVGNRVNIQDGTVMHTLYKKSKVDIKDDVTIGHNAMIHGAIIKKRALIGIGATVLDNAVVGENTIVAANALVLSNAKLEANSVYAGIPAKKIKDIEPEQSKDMNERIAKDYIMYAGWFKEKDSW
ncbi:MAG: gamma carbonic anhydrase family protein [Bacteroidales bacterium]